MKKLFTLFFALFTIYNSFGRVGLAEVYFSTPGGHGICHCDPYPDSKTPVLYGFDKLSNLKEWYFYKNHIIGIGQNYYFIFNESDEKIQYFDTRIVWWKAIENQKLKPIIIRWLDLSDSPDSFLFFIYMTSVITVPILLGVVILIIVLIRNRIIAWPMRNNLILLGLIVALAVMVYLELNVESI